VAAQLTASQEGLSSMRVIYYLRAESTATRSITAQRSTLIYSQAKGRTKQTCTDKQRQEVLWKTNRLLSLYCNFII
jgi:hypothetical protein